MRNCWRRDGRGEGVSRSMVSQSVRPSDSSNYMPALLCFEHHYQASNHHATSPHPTHHYPPPHPRPLGVRMRYREDFDPVLRGVTLQIAPGSSVGIVGRTGSGTTEIWVVKT